jgi:hypothetical protein
MKLRQDSLEAMLNRCSKDLAKGLRCVNKHLTLVRKQIPLKPAVERFLTIFKPLGLAPLLNV